MGYYKKLLGDRIYLSPKGESEEEIEKFTEWLNDPQITDFNGKTSQVITLFNVKELLESYRNNKDIREFNIIDLYENKLIGTVELREINWIERSAELGLYIGDSEYRNNGYGTEAIRIILEYGFKYLNLHSIRLRLVSINERAHQCYLKCGFKDMGVSREQAFINGKYYDKIYMDIIENEFEGDFIRNKNVK